MPRRTGTTKDQIRIRMYRVGFGDCFLLTLPASGGPHHILVDCGVHARGDIDTIGRAVDDIAQVTARKLDVIIVTHAHQDHISGFGTYAAEFSAFEVKEVWMPWTENPDDPQASKLKKKQLALVENLSQHFAAQRGAKFDAVRAALLNLAGNQAAFDLLRTGLRGARLQYYEAGKELKDPAGVLGLVVKVLGPPRDQEFLAQMDPPAGQRYIRLVKGRKVEVNAARPFALAADAGPGSPGPRLSQKDARILQEMAASPMEGLAFALDQAINNTSLVTLFLYKGKNLLFPGDAQYGNWRFWLDKDGSDRLLSQINFYKVSHHGSVNATPKNALEKMTTGKFAAMLSTQSKPWPSIPEARLLDALERKANRRVVRSDSLAVAGAPGVAMAKLPQGFAKGDLWYDYFLPLG
jgi:beta-lactamase superfamily II metal-dependent hydrolase